jgi:hypothetical protein
MTLYEIDRQIEDLIDPETGEITDYAALDALSMAREDKIRQIVYARRNALADLNAVSAEIARLKKIEETLVNRVESIDGYLKYALNGEKYKDETTTIYYRKTTAVVVAEDAVAPEEFLRYGKPTVNKTALGEAIRGGMVIPGVSIEERNNIVIK